MTGHPWRNWHCPFCWSASKIRYRSRTQDFKCYNCGHEFEKDEHTQGFEIKQILGPEPIAMRAFHRQL